MFRGISISCLLASNYHCFCQVLYCGYQRLLEWHCTNVACVRCYCPLCRSRRQQTSWSICDLPQTDNLKLLRAFLSMEDENEVRACDHLLLDEPSTGVCGLQIIKPTDANQLLDCLLIILLSRSPCDDPSPV